MSSLTYVGKEGTPLPSSTSASGAMVGSPMGVLLLLRGPHYVEGTAARRLVAEDWDQVLVPLPQTSAGSTQDEEGEEAQSTSAAIMELRRLSGLTWEHLATLFGVSRRSLHFWASDKPVNAPNEERLRRVLSVVRKADRGFAAKNRAMLFQGRDGMVPFDFLAGGEYDAFIELVGAGPGRRELSLAPLSPEAGEARKPDRPEELIGALQDRVPTDAGKARPGRSVKIKK